MKVTFENNVLTVVTAIKKETIEKGIAALELRDDKGNQVYAIGRSDDGAITKFSLGYNTFVDGYAAVTKVLPMETTKEDVMKNYGEALVLAKKYTEIIAAAAEEKEATINALFESVTDAQ